MSDQQTGYVLAIDGGQSNTSCLVGLTDGTLLGSGSAGPCAVPNAAHSEPLMRAALTSCIQQVLKGLHPHPQKMAAAYLSLTGGTATALAFLPTLIPVDRILAESDSVAALASGALGGPGATVISGTGCVAYAQNQNGERVERGGWGYLLGDEGSGFWIGLQAVRAAIRAEDGRGLSTPFTIQVKEELGVQDMREAQSKIYNDEIRRPEIAHMARMVMQSSENGDPLAAVIVEQAAEELFILARSICQAANFQDDIERVLVPAGGVLKKTSPVLRQFAAHIQAEMPEIRLIHPRFPPVVGAFILGLQLVGVSITNNVLERIQETLPKLSPDTLKT